MRALLAAAVCAVALTSCGGSGEEPAAATPAAADAFPVTIEHKYGKTTVTEAPKRVVVVGLREQDALLALGVRPVAVTEWLKRTIHPWAEQALGEEAPPAVLPASDGIEIEKVAAQRPDLIVGIYSAMTEREYTTLSKLAPVVAQPGDVPDFGTDFRRETEILGRAVGQPEKAKALIADVDAKYAAARKAHPALEGASAAAVTTYEGVYVFGRNDTRPQLLRGLGLEVPEALDEITGSDFGAQLSEERLDLIDTDVLLWQLEPQQRKEVEGNPAVRQLDAYKQDRIVYSTPGDLDDAMTFATVLSLPTAIDGMAPRLAAVLEDR